ncbi:hypothetical protein KIN20_023182 [Parelaphostrongylus tenuis]|uniref:Uncharacterized protein n=1 Tax=Parelaphostrongylus tenuis TaxID=148309 RepID=A0AAD5MV69_PARTN|nr:hypothetical protein KIN20_023182 [Parelaphostrongylus tenuis]
MESIEDIPKAVKDIKKPTDASSPPTTAKTPLNTSEPQKPLRDPKEHSRKDNGTTPVIPTATKKPVNEPEKKDVPKAKILFDELEAHATIPLGKRNRSRLHRRRNQIVNQIISTFRRYYLMAEEKHMRPSYQKKKCQSQTKKKNSPPTK